MIQKDNKNELLDGIKLSIPICLGYIPVSFAFGMMARQGGLSAWIAVLISMTNLTSAGQFAGTELILNGALYIEIAVTTFVINLRYMLMSLSLSQKVDENMPFATRAILSFGITDEIFAVASQRKGQVSGYFFAGLIIAPYFGWALGTLLGAVAANILPPIIISALGISIYGMFLAIIIPPAKQERSVLIVILISVILSSLFFYVPVLKGLSSGWSIIICTMVASSVGAVLFPVEKA